MLSRNWLAVLLVACSAVTASAQTDYILELHPNANVNALAAEYQFTILKSWGSGSELGYKVSAPPLSATQIASVRAQAGVVDFEVDATVDSTESNPTSKAAGALQTLGAYAFDSTTVTYYGATVRNGYVNQPAMQLIELGNSRLLAPAGLGTVAIIDTGVDPSHPALAGVLMTGYDFTRDQPGASELADLSQSTVAILDQSTVAILDSKNLPVVLNQSTVAILDQSTVAILDGGNLPKAFGHGTMVAGLVHLVAPAARILPLKAFHSDGTANLSDIVRAIRYAADNGANVLAMSFTFDTLSPDLQAAIQYATGKGVICVASAGNNGSERAYYPAALPQVIGVGSTNFADQRSPFSNYDNSAITSAPGEALVTTYPGNNYAAVWGTSFSAPLVAGSIALYKQVAPHLKLDDLQDVMDSGVAIHQNMGARLDLVKGLTFCLRMD